MTSSCSSECHVKLQRSFLLRKPLPHVILTAFISLGLFLSPTLATAASLIVHSWLDVPAEWNATVEVVNLAPMVSAVRLLAYDVVGSFLGEIPGGMTLAPGERGSYSTSTGVFPPEITLLKVLADVPLASVVLLEATNASAQEILLPGSAPAPDLTLPVLNGSPPWTSQLRLVNAGTAPTTPTIAARDSAGQVLASVSMPALAPWASNTVDVSTLFAPALPASAATLQVTADQPLAAMQRLGATDRLDVAALPAPLGQGTQLLLPVVTQGPTGSLWTLAGVLNPQDAEVTITAEALDSQGQSLGRLVELTTLPARGSHVFRTPDLGGSLPSGTAVLLLTANLPLSGYALIGGAAPAGVTALVAMGPADAPAGFDILAPFDSHTLMVTPWWRWTAGQSLSAVEQPGTGVWTQRLSTGTGQLTLTWTDTANDFDGFKIERKTGTDGTYAALPKLGAVFSYTDIGLPVGTEYCYQVRAYNTAGYSPPSNEACGTVATPVLYSLAVSKDGAGTGTITSSPTGIDCGSICSANFTSGTSVTLTATSVIGSTFTGWSGACSSTGACAVSMDAAKSVSATFTLQDFTLTVTKGGTGTGTVTSSPAGIACGSTCTADIPAGASLTLTAAATVGSTFTGWGGACTGSGTCTVTLEAAKTVTASFALPTTGGLVAAYAFSEGSGSMVADASGNGHTGTLTGTTWTSAGKYGGTLSFNGTSSWVTVADSSLLDLTTDLTLQAWVSPTAVSSNWASAIIKERPGGLAYALYATDGAMHPAAYVNLGGGDIGIAGSSSLPANTWSHLAMTFDGATLRLFVNGSQVGSRSAAGSLVTSTAPLRFGGNSVWGEYFAGKIDEARIYNRVLTSPEIQGDMTTPVGPPVSPPVPLTVAKAGTGSGAVSSAPAGVDCGSTCGASFAAGSSVTLTALPAIGALFTGWSGACTGTGTCMLTMDAAKTVTATFTLQSFTLSVGKSGTGTGSVTSTPAGIDCGSTCSAGFSYGSSVTLTAAAANGSTFADWSGDCTGTGTCIVAMTQVRNATATIQDTTFPTVNHSPVTSGAANTAIKITAIITDNVGVQAATLFYRMTGTGPFTQVGMTLTGGIYTATIPAGVVTKTGVQYYLEALDAASNVRHLPTTAPGTPYGVVVGTTVFTDDLSAPGTTPIRVQHFTELRSAINGLWAKYGVPGNFDWSEPDPTGCPAAPTYRCGVRATHLAQLRTALDQAYTKAAKTHSPYAEDITAGTTIKASHLAELRTFVRGLE